MIYDAPAAILEAPPQPAPAAIVVPTPQRPGPSTGVQPSPPPSTEAIAVSGTSWLQLPDAADFADVYPARAKLLGSSGRVVLICGVKASGALKNCKVQSETPPDQGFGNAALRLSAKFKMRSDAAGGRSLEGGVVRVPLTFYTR